MKVTCLVDNAVRLNSNLWGEHGLAYLVDTPDGRLLFDTGQSGAVLLHNLKALDIAPATIDAVAISHAHDDHTGGLPDLLPRLRPGIPLFANADLFRERYLRHEASTESIGIPLSRDEIAERLNVMLSAGPQEILPGVWTTGEIAVRPEFQGSGIGLLMRGPGAPVADEYRDDMALGLQTRAGLALLCGCCHAGLLNTLTHVERAFARPVTAIIGGLHLGSVSEDDLRRSGARLSAMAGLRRVCPGHCTGEAAFLHLAQALGPAVVHSGAAGNVLDFA
jgi:7,8-dihydropterin-6-yl-methyl-4-(beta-D-ribofuranosyl)aminobenzene 5'-phosphate synthase